jgi:hypothetical protein
MSFNHDHMKSLGLTLTGITVSLLGASGAIAQATFGPSPCNTRDVQVVILIEDHGTANDVAPERLAKAVLAQLDARAACSDGRVTEGIARYDEIGGDNPDNSLKM